ncbi:MAG TPA: hypothetical protein VHS09_10975 [Polyangiaceae bacterium]|jgi:hypothetical protein|nr:hypothetical protein [Polyangiaceae bacterium]
MYAPPAYPPAGPPDLAGPGMPLTREQARSKIIVQGIALATISGLLILVFLLDLFLFANGMPIGATSSVPPEMQAWIRPFTIAVCIFAALANVFNVVAAVQMLRVRSWGLALAGCIVAAIPVTSSACCLLTLPFSIWGIVQLVKPEIRAAFKLPDA